MSENLEREFIADLAKIFNKAPEELHRETRFLQDLKATSNRMFAVAGMMEDLADASVSYVDANSCTTIGDAVDLVEKLKAKSAE
jgi:acyl carrier protein